MPTGDELAASSVTEAEPGYAGVSTGRLDDVVDKPSTPAERARRYRRRKRLRVSSRSSRDAPLGGRHRNPSRPRADPYVDIEALTAEACKPRREAC